MIKTKLLLSTTSAWIRGNSNHREVAASEDKEITKASVLIRMGE